MTVGRVLIFGGGAREHALAWRLARDPGVSEVHVAPGNPGMADVATVHPGVAIGDLDGLERVVDVTAPDLIVIGPEAPLAAGVVDRLSAAGALVFGPAQSAARLETSKAFCRRLAESIGIPMADGAGFTDPEAAIRFARSLAAPVAVKADGLAAGKGVTLCATLVEAEAAIHALGPRVIVERQLVGPEASLMAICDGERAIALPPARDYKRAGDGDTGPNTGGMGAFSPLPDLDESIVERLLDAFHRPALAEMSRRGTPFRGVLYAGLLLTDDGPRLLEFNVRFGDPEAEAMLPLISGNLAETLAAAARGQLLESTIGAAPGAAVAVVLAAAGYPAAPRTGDPITGLDAAIESGALVFHGATSAADGRPYTAGGRVLTVVGQGADVAAAQAAAYRAAASIHFEGAHFRSDVAAAALAAVGAWSEAAPPVLVAIVVGSPNDVKRLDEATAVLDWFGIGYEVQVASAHRSPRKVLELAEGAAARGIRVFVAGAGKAAALPGAIASSTTLPVIGLPFSSADLGGLDALLSAVQMPRGVPVATVAIDGTANAAILAAEICALGDDPIAARLKEFKAELAAGADVMALVKPA